LKIFPAPDDEPAPSYTDPRDLAFFAMRPDRRYRARAPFRREIRQAKRGGHDLSLAPGQSLAVIVTRVGSGIIITAFAKVRLDNPRVYPNSDDDIRGGFTRGPRPTAPVGEPA
jgi:hypothetical protein